MANPIEPSAAYAKIEELLAHIEKEPTDFLALTAFNSYFKNLPYGTLTDEQLNTVYARVGKIKHDNALAMQFTVLEYQVDQTLAMQ